MILPCSLLDLKKRKKEKKKAIAIKRESSRHCEPFSNSVRSEVVQPIAQGERHASSRPLVSPLHILARRACASFECSSLGRLPGALCCVLIFLFHLHHHHSSGTVPDIFFFSPVVHRCVSRTHPPPPSLPPSLSLAHHHQHRWVALFVDAVRVRGPSSPRTPPSARGPRSTGRM